MSLLFASLLLTQPVIFEPNSPATRFAVVVGQAEGKPGQSTLKYARRDAQRMRDVLLRSAGFGPAHTTLLQDPEPADLWSQLDDTEREIEARALRDEDTVLFFYYSGHADIHGLNFKNERLSYDALRKRLEAIPARLKVIILDACQSGAFSRIKGEPAMSYNTLDQLQTEGTVVLASSRGSEFSQESDIYQASYFTHHLLSALSGAADKNRDGRVSLFETYEYTRHKTLSSTARSRAGVQHVTLEADLAGSQDAALSFVRRTQAHLAIPAALSGRILVSHGEGEVVVAEVVKAPDEEVRLALAPGLYLAQLSHEGARYRCDVRLRGGRPAHLKLEDCSSVQRASIQSDRDKGGVAIAAWKKLQFELKLGHMHETTSAYTSRLEVFNYENDENDASCFLCGGLPRHRGFSLFYNVKPWLGMGFEYTTLDDGDYRLPVPNNPSRDHQTFHWNAKAALFKLRLRRVLVDGHLNPFVEFGAGPGFVDEGFGLRGDRTVHRAPVLQGAVGLEMRVVRALGLGIAVGRIHAPILRNTLNEVHQSGGWYFSFSLITGVRDDP